MARSPLKQAHIDPLQKLRDALVQRYALERQLGRGGMATVYFPRDLSRFRKLVQ